MGRTHPIRKNHKGRVFVQWWRRKNRHGCVVYSGYEGFKSIELSST